MVERTVQTNVLELLGVDDLLPKDSMLRKKINLEGDHNQKIDERSVNEENDLEEAVQGIGKDLMSNVLNQFEGF